MRSKGKYASADISKKAVEKVKEGKTEEEKLKGLEDIMSFVEQIDLAKDLHKIGGFSTIISLLDDSSEKVRAAAAQVVGTTVHNNPEPQKLANELGALNGLVRILSNPDATPNELTKSLYGISSLIRHNDEATVKFVKEHKGLALTLNVLGLAYNGEASEKFLPAKRKAIFVMLYIITRAPAIIPATAPSIVPQVSTALKAHANDPDFRENALLVLQVFSMNDKVNLSNEHKKMAFDSARHTLEITKREEDEKSQQVCEELLVAWKI